MFGRGAPAASDAQDLWLVLTDELWRGNAFSELPIDLAEMGRAFRQVWHDAIRNPGRVRRSVPSDSAPY